MVWCYVAKTSVGRWPVPLMLANGLLCALRRVRARVMKDIFDRQAAQRRLLICIGPCCNSTGTAQMLLEGLRAELVQARLNADLVSEASCVRRSCLGKCTGEPLAYAHPEGTWYHRLTVENLVRILREHVLGSRAVPELILDEDP